MVRLNALRGYMALTVFIGLGSVPATNIGAVPSGGLRGFLARMFFIYQCWSGTMGMAGYR